MNKTHLLRKIAVLKELSSQGKTIILEKTFQKKIWHDLFTIPKYTYKNGYTDEGISGNLDNPTGFKYSELFLKRWYGSV